MRTEGNTQQSFDNVRASMQRDHVDDRKDAAASAQGPSGKARPSGDSRKPSREEIRDFKALMQRDAKPEKSAVGRRGSPAAHPQVRGQFVFQLSGQPTTYQAGDRFDRDSGLPQHAPGWLPHAEASTVQHMPAQALGAPPPASAPPALGPALAELIEKHVRQLLVSENAGNDRGGDVLLRMSDAALPGTDLWLRRTERGWKVRADVRSRDSYDAIVAGSDRLIKSFAEHHLGELEIEPVYQGA